MRSMAEERHSRTDQLVLTAPVSLGKMIFGKFLAMVGVFTVAVAVIAVTPLVLAAFGTVPGDPFLSPGPADHPLGF